MGLITSQDPKNTQDGINYIPVIFPGISIDHFGVFQLFQFPFLYWSTLGIIFFLGWSLSQKKKLAAKKHMLQHFSGVASQVVDLTLKIQCVGVVFQCCSSGLYA